MNAAVATVVANKLKASQQEAPILVGMDDGHAYTKLYVDGGTSLKIRSSVRAGLHAIASMSGEGDMDGCYEIDGLRYSIGDGIDGENTRFDDYPGSALNLVSVHHALRLAGLGGRNVKIATGLPVRQFYGTDGRINRALIEHKRNGFIKEIGIVGGGAKKAANIVDHLVCSEAVSAWLDYVLDDEGKPIKDRDDGGVVGIVDVGGRTTDTVWICPPDKIDHEHSGTADIGVLNVFDDIANAIRAEHKVEIGREKLEQAVMTKTIKLYGEPVNLTSIVDTAVANMAERIHREIQRKFGDGAELNRILFVGGGAALMPQLKDFFKHGYVPENPEFANARGMLKFMKHRG